MTFENFWTEVKNTGLLPEMAIEQIPHSLSESMKKRLTKQPPERIATYLVDAIDQINHGSIETIESIVEKRL